jgi:hypothetical protein
MEVGPLRCPVVINCRDRLAPLVPLVEWLERLGQTEIYLLDNDSTYPPLLEYYERTPHEVVRLGENLGHRALWLTDVLKDRMLSSEYYVYTDPDVVPIPECPPDVFDFFCSVLEHFSDFDKVGFGLRIDDIPEHYRFKAEVIAWEEQFWQEQLASGLYRAPIDTTFALYRGQGGHDLHKAIRTGYPYLARHISWYSDSANPTDEERYYRQRARDDTTHWTLNELPSRLLDGISALRIEGGAQTPSVSSAAVLTSAWDGEPPAHDESVHTPWARTGWSAWNGMSPEVEFCELAAALTRFFAADVVVETGTGQGFITRRIAAVLDAEQLLICFESDPVVRSSLRVLPFFAQANREMSDLPRPSAADFSRAGLSILDSDFPDRFVEVELWWEAAKPGSVVLLHDCGNGHPPGTGHRQLHDLITRIGVPGIFLRNPRGSFLGFKSPMATKASEDSFQSILEQKRALETELAELKSSRSFRYTQLARWVRAALGRKVGELRSRDRMA